MKTKLEFGLICPYQAEKLYLVCNVREKGA